MTQSGSAQGDVRRWNAAELAAHAAMGRTTAKQRLIPALVKAGVIARQGRCWYGRAADIDAWLLGRWSPQALRGEALP